MKRTLALMTVIAAVVLGSSRIQAVSNPVVQGFVSGIELCPQDWCGSAIFVGIYQGQVGFNPNAFGLMVVAVQHEPLPTVPGASAAITGGVWELSAGFRRLRGGAIGLLTNNGDNSYSVATLLPIVSGGSGSLVFEGRLDHNVFPPTIQGRITQ